MNDAVDFANEISTEIESIERAFQKLIAAQTVKEAGENKNNNEKPENERTRLVPKAYQD